MQLTRAVQSRLLISLPIFGIKKNVFHSNHEDEFAQILMMNEKSFT